MKNSYYLGSAASHPVPFVIGASAILGPYTIIHPMDHTESDIKLPNKYSLKFKNLKSRRSQIMQVLISYPTTKKA